MSITSDHDWNRVEAIARAVPEPAALRAYEAQAYREMAHRWMNTADELTSHHAKAMALSFACEAHSRAVEIELKG